MFRLLLSSFSYRYAFELAVTKRNLKHVLNMISMPTFDKFDNIK